MDTRLAASLVFTFGAIAQVLIFNFRAYSKERTLKLGLVFLASLAFSSLGLLDAMPLYTTMFIFSSLFSAVACYYFCTEFSQKINEWTIIFLNSVVGFLVVFYGFRFYGFSPFLIFLSLVILVNQLFLVLGKSFSAFSRAYFYVWYLIFILVLTAIQLNSAVFSMVFGDLDMTFRFWEVFVSGMIYVNLWLSLNLLLPLLPIKVKTKTYTEKIEEVKAHAEVLSSKFSHGSQNMLSKFGFFLGLVVSLWLSLAYFGVDFKYVLAVVLLILGFLGFESRNKQGIVE